MEFSWNFLENFPIFLIKNSRSFSSISEWIQRPSSPQGQVPETNFFDSGSMRPYDSEVRGARQKNKYRGMQRLEGIHREIYRSVGQSLDTATATSPGSGSGPAYWYPRTASNGPS